MGIDAKIWGPHVWFFLHSVCITYPDKPSNIEIKTMQNAIEGVSKIIPCEICREHFVNAVNNGIKIKNKEILSPLNFNILSSRKKLFRWMYDFHDFVNRYKVSDVKTISPSFEKVVEYWNIMLTNKDDMLIY